MRLPWLLKKSKQNSWASNVVSKISYVRRMAASITSKCTNIRMLRSHKFKRQMQYGGSWNDGYY